MTRYVEVAGHGYPFPDDDPRSDADIVEHVARCNREIREEFLRRKHEKRLAEKVVPIRPQGISVIAIGPAVGVIGGGKAHGTPIGSKRR